MKATRPSKMSLIGWVALAVFNCITVPYIGRGWQPPHDFGMFFTAAHLYLHSDPSKLYDLDVQARVQQQLYGIPDDQLQKRFCPYNHLPYEALLYLPLTKLSASRAFLVWRLVSLVLLAISVWSFVKAFPMHRNTGELLAMVFAFFPVPFCFLTGQDTFVTLAIIVESLWLLKKRMPLLAGLILGLGLFKFQLVVPIAAVFFLRRSWRVVAGFAASGLTVLGISTVMVGYAGMAGLLRLWIKGETGGIACINPLTMPNVRGLLSCIPGLAPHIATVGALAVSVLLLFLVVRQGPYAPSIAHFFATTLCFVILVGFHTNLYDLVLLLLPAFVLLESYSQVKRRRWRVLIPLFLLMCPITYLAVLVVFRVALLSILVAWLWYALFITMKGRSEVRLESIITTPELAVVR